MKHPHYNGDSDVLNTLLMAVRHEERKGRAQAVAERLNTLATHISRQGLNGIEAAELIRHEALRYRNESLELH
ncbi:DUF2732 family protein [Pantoea sp. KPR_PJ]|uniref:DUF2732 family protein n=1 Tax=Pantoea sp. KPR_PJ TaxID=2738375 RepID=UPI0035277E51